MECIIVLLQRGNAFGAATTSCVCLLLLLHYSQPHAHQRDGGGGFSFSQGRDTVNHAAHPLVTPLCAYSRYEQCVFGTICHCRGDVCALKTASFLAAVEPFFCCLNKKRPAEFVSCLLKVAANRFSSSSFNSHTRHCDVALFCQEGG